MSNNYWCKAPTNEIANEIKNKFEEHITWLNSTGYGPAMQSVYDAYYNFSDGGFGLQLSKDKSSAKIKVNHLKSLIQRIQGMVTNAKLQFAPRARNSDAKSQIQADFARGLLEYYQDEKNMDEFTSELVERALIMLEAYIYAPFDKSMGIEITKDEQGMPIMAGDQSFQCLSAYDVAYNHRQKKTPYYIVRVQVNKWDLAAQYPQDVAERITAVSDTRSASTMDRIVTPFDNQDVESDEDMVYKYILMHDRTTALPKGRYTEIVGDIVLVDSALQYKTIPVVRLTCSDLLETVGGDSPATSLLSLQEPMDKLWSAVTTNNLASAKQNVWAPTDIDIKSLSEGQNLIISANAPQALQLTQSSPETYKLIESYQVQLETLSGVNKTARGNPDSTVKTAAGQALMLAQAVEFVSDLQRQYARAVGDLATIVIHNLQVFATTPRIAYIGGVSRKAYAKEFKSDDIAQVDRVSVDLGNPLTQTISGRYTLATEWVQAGIIKDPSKLNEFLRTGQVDSLTEDQFKDSLLIREENEQIRKGEAPLASILDIHPQHILEHKELAADPDFRNNPELMKLLQDHIQEHINLMKGMDPDLAAIMGIPPLPSQQMPPPPQAPNPPPPDDKIAGVNPPNLPPQTPPQFQDAYNQYLAQVPPINEDQG